MDTEDFAEDHVGAGHPRARRILKVRLRQDQVIRLHEMRILRGTSIAALLEGILEDYFARNPSDTNLPHQTLDDGLGDDFVPELADDAL